MSDRDNSTGQSKSAHNDEEFIEAMNKHLPKPSFKIEALEPRILLSATALDAEDVDGDGDAGPPVEDVAEVIEGDSGDPANDLFGDQPAGDQGAEGAPVEPVDVPPISLLPKSADVSLAADGVDNAVTGGQVGLAAAATGSDDFNVEEGRPAPVAELEPEDQAMPHDELDPQDQPDQVAGTGGTQAFAPAPAAPEPGPQQAVEVVPPLNNSLDDTNLPQAEAAKSVRPAVQPAAPTVEDGAASVDQPVQDSTASDGSSGLETAEACDPFEDHSADEGARACLFEPTTASASETDSVARRGEQRDGGDPGSVGADPVAGAGDASRDEILKAAAGLTSTPQTTEWSDSDSLAILDPNGASPDPQRLAEALDSAEQRLAGADGATPHALDAGSAVGRDVDHSGSPFDMIDGTRPFDEVFEANDKEAGAGSAASILPPAPNFGESDEAGGQTDRAGFAGSTVGQTAKVGMVAQLWGLLRSTFGSSRRTDDIDHEKQQVKR